MRCSCARPQPASRPTTTSRWPGYLTACDVLQADGGTRTASITGAYVALVDAVASLREEGALSGDPMTGSVAAVSVGIIDGEPRLDLPYVEDVRAETDMNIVMTGGGRFIEVQGTGEGGTFSVAQLGALTGMALVVAGLAVLTLLTDTNTRVGNNPRT